MTCSSCQGRFCWICLGTLSKVNPYSHFNNPNTPCFNQLVPAYTVLHTICVCYPMYVLTREANTNIIYTIIKVGNITGLLTNNCLYLYLFSLQIVSGIGNGRWRGWCLEWWRWIRKCLKELYTQCTLFLHTLTRLDKPNLIRVNFSLSNQLCVYICNILNCAFT